MRVSNTNLERSERAQSTRIGLINDANRMIVSNDLVCFYLQKQKTKHSTVSIFLISDKFHTEFMYAYVNKSTYVRWS